MYLLDSSAIIEVLAASNLGKRIADLTRSSPLATTTISLVEVMAGVEGRTAQIAERFISTMKLYSFDKAAADESIVLEKVLKKQGKIIARQDLFIAAISKCHQCVLVTCDKDFENISQLKVKIVE